MATGVGALRSPVTHTIKCGWAISELTNNNWISFDLDVIVRSACLLLFLYENIGPSSCVHY